MNTEIEELIAGSEPNMLAAPDVDALRARGRRRRAARRTIQSSGTLAIIAAVAVGLTALPPQNVSVAPLGDGSAPPSAGDTATAPWQVLPTAHGWSAEILEIREDGGPPPVSGEYQFVNLASNVEIHWFIGDDRDELIGDDPSAIVEDTTILGHDGVVVVASETDPLRAVWFDGKRTFQARGYEIGRARFDEFLASLVVADDATWSDTRARMLADREPVVAGDQRMHPAPTEASWQLLLDDPAWDVTWASSRDVDDGLVDAEIRFMTDVGSPPEVSITAIPGFTEPGKVVDGEPTGTRAVVGQQATLLEENDLEHHAVWFDGFHTIVVRTAGLDAVGRDELLDAMYVADDTEWVAALPDDVLADDRITRHVEKALGELPLATDLGRDDIWQGDTAPTVQLDSIMAARVSCGWVSSWIDATSSGDAETARAAGESMQKIRAWADGRITPEAGGMPQVIAQYAEAIGIDGQGDGEIIGGRPSTVEATYRDALGC